MAEKVLKKTISKTSSGKTRELGMIIFIVIISIFVQMRNPSFLTFENINDLIKNTAILSILAVGRGILVSLISLWIVFFITNENFRRIDSYLSILREASFVGVAAIGMTFCIIILAFGAIFGAINGFLYSKVRLPSFIATLAMSYI